MTPVIHSVCECWLGKRRVRVPFFLAALYLSACATAVRQPPHVPLPQAGPNPDPTQNAAPASTSDKPIAEIPAPIESQSWGASPKDLASFVRSTRPMGSEYLLYKGDTLDINVIGYPEFSGEFGILDDGNVAVPFGPTLYAEGMTLEEFRDKWTRLVRRYAPNAKVSVTVKKAGPRMATVMGDVPKPGRTPILGQGSLLEVLMATSWNLDPSQAQAVTVIRGGTNVEFPLNHLAGKPDYRYNIQILPDDLVIVRSPAPVKIHGAVAKPALYDVGTKGWLSVREIVTQAGGIASGASLKEAAIIRASGREEKIDLNDALFGHPDLAPQLQPGDTLYIPHSREIGIYVLGMVNRPGLYRQAGKITVMQALALADQAQFGAVLSHAKLVRNYGGAEQEVVDLNLERVIAKGDLRHDMAMHDGDVLFVPESGTSDALDFLGRLLTPLSAGAGVATQVKVLRE